MELIGSYLKITGDTRVWVDLKPSEDVPSSVMAEMTNAKVPVAALAGISHCISTLLHPQGTDVCLHRYLVSHDASLYNTSHRPLLFFLSTVKNVFPICKAQLCVAVLVVRYPVLTIKLFLGCPAWKVTDTVDYKGG